MSVSPLTFNVESRLNELLWKYNIPGVSVSIMENGQLSSYVSGITNIRTKTPVTSETIFLIGSITKVLTTTLIMQLVDSGDVELDQPVSSYLPNLHLSDPESTKTVTVRHLLNHTNGISGDYLDDFGRGDDAVEKYVQSFSDLPLLYSPGKMYSYSNSAFMLAGYLVERLTGQTWHDALRTRLLAPAGLTSTVTLPEDALRFSTAVAHQRLLTPVGGLLVGEMWREFHAGAPAGFTPYATPTDLVRFADIHLNGGRSGSGEQILSESSVSAMQETNVDSIPSGPFDVVGWGLGWILHRYGTERVFGHNGGSAATLRVLPEKNFSIAVLTNASGGVRLAQDLISEVVGEKFGLSIPDGPASTSDLAPTSLSSYEGTYQHLGYSATVTVSDGQLQLTSGAKSSQPGETVVLTPIDQETFVGHFRDRGNAKVSFLSPDGSGAPRFLHMGLRAYRRQS